MKAIVVRQPWATLIALGVKTIETRPAPPSGPMRPAGVRGLPGCSVYRHERVAICSAAWVPTAGEDVGDWYWEDTPADPQCIVNPHSYRCEPAPLGAVVCTAVVADALPIFATDHSGTHRTPHLTSSRHVPTRLIEYHRAIDSGTGTLYDEWIRHDDQLPLGDFDPGRWGWMLTDPQPCDPIPVTGRQGVFALPDGVWPIR